MPKKVKQSNALDAIKIILQPSLDYLEDKGWEDQSPKLGEGSVTISPSTGSVYLSLLVSNAKNPDLGAKELISQAKKGFKRFRLKGVKAEPFAGAIDTYELDILFSPKGKTRGQMASSQIAKKQTPKALKHLVLVRARKTMKDIKNAYVAVGKDRIAVSLFVKAGDVALLDVKAVGKSLEDVLGAKYTTFREGMKTSGDNSESVRLTFKPN